MFKRLLSSALIFGMAAIAPPALAANCAPRAGMVEQLQEHYAETLTSAGLQTGQTVKTLLEIWSSKDTGTFTVLVTHPSGISCIVASGDSYFEVSGASMLPGAAS